MIDGFNPCPTSKQRCCGLNTHGCGVQNPRGERSGFPEVRGSPGCAARRERDADPLLGSKAGCKLLSSLPAPAGIRLYSVRSQICCQVCQGQKRFGVFAEHAVMSPSQTNVYREGNRCR